jgi:hypothetical protein
LRRCRFFSLRRPTGFAITLYCPRKLAVPLRLGRLRRCRRESVGIRFGHNCPGDARRLIRQGYGDNQARSAAA